MFILLQGIFAVECIYAAVFLVLLVACVYVFLHTRQRVAYSVLLFAIFLQFTELIIGVANGGLIVFDPTMGYNVVQYVAFNAIGLFFPSWSQAALYCSIFLLLRSRDCDLLEASQPPALGSRLSIFATSVHYALLALVVVLGTAANGLYITYLRENYDAPAPSPPISPHYFPLNYATTAFECLTAFDIAITSGAIYMYARKREVKDQVCAFTVLRL